MSLNNRRVMLSYAHLEEFTYLHLYYQRFNICYPRLGLNRYLCVLTIRNYINYKRVCISLIKQNSSRVMNIL